MGKKNYVPSGCQLLCDKGAMPTPLTVTSNKSTIYGDKMATEADMKPGENIQPFGACSVKNGSPCSFAPVYWDKCINGVKVNGKKLIIQDAKLLCSQGGKISIFLSKADAMTAAGITAIATGIGIVNATSYLDNNFGDLSRALQGVDPTILPNSTQKGNFGELRTELDLKSKGYNVISNSQATSVRGGGHTGLDMAVTDPRGNTDILVESKYKSGFGKPGMGNTKGGGKQMSNRWFNQNRGYRLTNSMSPQDAARIRGKIRSGSGLLRLAAKVSPDGTVSYYNIDANGRVGNPTNVPAANVMSGNSRVANSINNISRNIQANSSVATANRWMVNNASKISRVGRVVGRGLIVVGVVSEAYNIGNAYQQDGGQVGENTKRAIGSAAGGLAGGLAGAKLGAMIGVVGGPVGVVVGGIVGGIVGGFIGAFAGIKISSWF